MAQKSLKGKAAVARRAEPDLPVEPEAMEAGAALYPHEGPWVDTLLADVSAAGGTAHSLQLRGCVVERGDWKELKAVSMRLRDSRFERCDLANGVWRGLEAVRTEFRECRFTGWQAVESDIQDALFQGCTGRFLQLRFAQLKRCEFVDCDLEEADFTEADLRGVVFRNCRLVRAEFSGAKLEGTDWRGSNLDGVRVRAEDVRGVIVEPAQALILAPLLGIEIR